MTNRLAASSSPYLRQHAENPVDWHPWGDEALGLARSLDRPILLSIGYSACHWCHVMAHESFERAATADVMNAHFVNIKVDREERPDIDAVYMEAVQAMTGHGGWPLTVFLTPDAEPFYGGTYFPPESRHGITGFPDLLAAIADAWRHRRGEVESGAQRLTAAIRAVASWTGPEDAPALADIDAAAARIAAHFDAREGGFGGAPKFPQASTLAFLLGRAGRSRDRALLGQATSTLAAMARGGIRDHLGGGFHRYSVDAGWAVPHFEKMLYDNAQLARLYVEAWQATGMPLFAEVAIDTLDYLAREMTGPHGAFHAAQDADTPAGEGAFFVWTPAELDAVLGATLDVVAGPDPGVARDPELAQLAELAKAWYGVTARGNFEHGATVLSTRRPLAEVAAEAGLSEADARRRLAQARSMLLAARSRREAPATDTKLLVDWNGLAIDAFARAGVGLGRPDYLAAAARAAEFILDHAVVADGLAHSWTDGDVGAPGFVEDYGAMAGACITLYESTFDPVWIARSRRLVDTMIDQFLDPERGGFYRIGPRHGPLVVRQKEWIDGAVPSGNALAADALWRLAALTGDTRLTALAEGVVRGGRPYIERASSAVGALLAVADTLAVGPREVAIVGPAEAGAAELVETMRRHYLPGTVVALSAGVEDARGASVPLLADRTAVGGRAAAYVCRGHTCQAPVTERGALTALLDPAWPEGVDAEVWPGTDDNFGD